MVHYRLLVVLGLIAAVAGQSCTVPFVPIAGKCFYVEASEQGSSYTWQEARDYCIALGGDLNADLASYPTCDEFTEFARYLAFNSPGNLSLWVGAHTLFSENMWQWVTLEALQTGVPFWHYGSDYSSGYECAAANSEHYYRLMPDDCAATKPFACSYTPAVTKKVLTPKKAPTDCSNGGIIIGEYCYFFNTRLTSFDDADLQCRNDHGDKGGILYYPANCDEFTAMAHHLEAAEDNTKYWVGAVDITGQAEWTWVNGALLPGGPPYWASGEPSHDHGNQPREHCATMSLDRRFYLVDNHCIDTYSFICKLLLA